MRRARSAISSALPTVSLVERTAAATEQKDRFAVANRGTSAILLAVNLRAASHRRYSDQSPVEGDQ
jgi:hypothetical protein